VSRPRCATAGSTAAGTVAAAPTDRATVSAYQTSVNNNNNKQQHAVLAVSQTRTDATTWAGTKCQRSIWTRTDYKHLQSCVPTLCWLQTRVAAVWWEWRTVRHQNNDGGQLFCFHAVGSSHWQTETRIGRNVLCWQKWTGETSVLGTVRGKTFGGIIVSRGNVLHPCLTNLRRSD